jgi:hypothetical protein
MEVSHMGTITISLDKSYMRKMEIIRNRCYPSMLVDEAVKEFVKDTINAKVSDEEMKE